MFNSKASHGITTFNNSELVKVYAIHDCAVKVTPDLGLFLLEKAHGYPLVFGKLECILREIAIFSQDYAPEKKCYMTCVNKRCEYDDYFVSEYNDYRLHVIDNKGRHTSYYLLNASYNNWNHVSEMGSEELVNYILSTLLYQYMSSAEKADIKQADLAKKAQVWYEAIRTLEDTCNEDFILAHLLHECKYPLFPQK